MGLPSIPGLERGVVNPIYPQQEPCVFFVFFPNSQTTHPPTKGYLAMGRNPNRTPSEHPNPTNGIGSKMGGAPTPKWDPIGFDPQPNELSDWFAEMVIEFSVHVKTQSRHHNPHPRRFRIHLTNRNWCLVLGIGAPQWISKAAHISYTRHQSADAGRLSLWFAF